MAGTAAQLVAVIALTLLALRLQGAVAAQTPEIIIAGLSNRRAPRPERRG